jgi:hypothetical protein
MEITIGASFFTKRDMDINSGHCRKDKAILTLNVKDVVPFLLSLQFLNPKAFITFEK